MSRPQCSPTQGAFGFLQINLTIDLSADYAIWSRRVLEAPGSAGEKALRARLLIPKKHPAEQIPSEPEGLPPGLAGRFERPTGAVLPGYFAKALNWFQGATSAARSE
jgi:hypothetical protein